MVCFFFLDQALAFKKVYVMLTNLPRFFPWKYAEELPKIKERFNVAADSRLHLHAGFICKEEREFQEILTTVVFVLEISLKTLATKKKVSEWYNQFKANRAEAAQRQAQANAQGQGGSNGGYSDSYR